MTNPVKAAAAQAAGIRPRRGIAWWVLLAVAGVLVATPFVLGAVLAIMVHGRL